MIATAAGLEGKLDLDALLLVLVLLRNDTILDRIWTRSSPCYVGFY